MSESEIPAPEYIDDLNCTEVYAETTQTLFGSPGMLRIELCVNRLTHQVPIRVRAIVPVARFALDFVTAKALRDQINHCLEIAEKGAPPVQTPAASPKKH